MMLSSHWLVCCLLLLGATGLAASSSVAVEPEEEIVTEKQCPPYGCVLLPEELMDEAVRASISTLTSPDDGVSSATLTLIGYKGGSPDSQINQDRAFVVSPYYDDDDRQLLGVFDGHGHLGEQVSEHAVSNIPALLGEKLDGLTPGPDRDDAVSATLVEVFTELDASVPTAGVGGCTASVLLRIGDTLYAANAGDSRSFLVGHDAARNTTTVLYVTREDKAHLPEERERVERAGGRVYIPEKPGATSRVYFRDSRTGGQVGLAMSRSLGDWDAGRVGVVPTPLVDVLHLRDYTDACRTDAVTEAVLEDDGTSTVYTTAVATDCGQDGAGGTPLALFAVSATDGMMDEVTPQEIADVLAQSLYGSDSGTSDDPATEREHLLVACEKLIVHAAVGWNTRNRGQYRDDIAIAVSRIELPQKNMIEF